MLQRVVKVENALGLHARAAAKLVSLTTRYASDVWLRREGTSREIDAKSILSVLMLAASQGTPLVLSAQGEDEAEAVEAVGRLFEEKFGEER